jgi:tetratricopeptide (TPR) repeat protein
MSNQHQKVRAALGLSALGIVALAGLLAAARLARGQAVPSEDPVPLIILMNKIELNQLGDAERYLRDNPPVIKKRLEELIEQRDTRFDELGRFGATSGHDIHKKVLDQFISENNRYLKLFDLYRKVTNDQHTYKRFDARRLRYEGAFLTHDGEDLCGEELKWDEALKHYKMALEKLEAGFAIAKEINELRVMASAKINIGSTLIRMLETEKAIAAYNEGMKYSDQLPGELYRGMVRLNLGNTYVWTVEPEKAFQYANEALISFKKMGRGTWQSNAMMVIGNAQMEQKNFASSWETLSMALEVAKQSGEDRVRGKALMNLGAVAMQMKRPDAASYIHEAQEWYKSHGEVFTQIERDTVAIDGLMMLSRIYEGQGNAADAEKYRKAYMAAVADNIDTYNLTKSSPCAALYKANPRNKDNEARKQ